MSHLVVGKGAVGGSWNGMQDDMLTLSPGHWMALPGYSLEQYLQDHEDNMQVATLVHAEKITRPSLPTRTSVLLFA
jgi:hypothetical protein